MTEDAGKIVVIGGGVAGLCAAVYARRCGYQVELLEQHQSAGGLATSWRRGDYTFETCLHWLVGSNPSGILHAEWREVCDIDTLRFVDHDEFVRLEDEHGASLHIFTDVDRLEAELLNVAPEDEDEIRRFTSAIRHLVNFPMPHPGESWPARIANMLQMLPNLPLLWRLSHLSIEDYGRRFKHPLLRAFFDGGAMGNLSVLALVFSLAWMSGRNAGYAIGGSQALIRLIVERFVSLGGRVRYGARVSKILAEDDVATGVQLEGGEIIPADWVVSAADGHATIRDLLAGKYTDAAFDKAFASYETFPSYLQVSLGVARDLSQQPGYLRLVLDKATRSIHRLTFVRSRFASSISIRPSRRKARPPSPVSCRRGTSIGGRNFAARTISVIRRKSIALPTPSSPFSNAGCPVSVRTSTPSMCRRPRR